MKIEASEISRVSMLDKAVKMPLFGPNESTAAIESIDMDGFQFKGLIVSEPDDETVSMVIDLRTGICYHLLAVEPYIPDETAAVVAEEKQTLERQWKLEPVSND